MLEDGAKVLDADNDVEFVLDLDIVELVHLDRDVGVKGLFEDGLAVSAAPFLDLFGEACKVDEVAVLICVDVEELNAWSEMVHELAKCFGRDGPLVSCLLLVELCVGGCFDFVWENMRGSDPVPKRNPSNKTAFLANAIVNGYVAAFNGGVSPVGSLAATLSRSKDGE